MNRSIFIGRETEVANLQKYYDSKESEFVVIYGRRRVGKTFLVKEFFDDKYDFKVTGLYKKPKKIQLKNFALALEEYGYPLKSTPADWLEAFSALKQLLKKTDSDNRKKVVFIDELPWLDTPKSDFLAAFESFWNGWGAQQDNLMLVVCGSATTWISKNLLEDVGGLFNRAARRIYLRPFSLNETERYFQSRGIQWSRYDIVQTYMIMGGIPYYLKLLDGTVPLSVNIDNIFFKKKGPLWNEFSILYETLFGRSGLYLKIISTLSSKKSGLTQSEITQEAKVPQNGAFTKALKDLVRCDFIRAYNCFGKNTGNITYQLCDYYTLFYFRFIKGQLNPDEHYWTLTLDNPARAAWAGNSFEQVCKDHLWQIRRALGINGVLSNASSWNGQFDGNGAQIDLIIERRDRVIDICEAKYSIDEYIIDKEYESRLRNKISVFKAATKTKSAVRLVMITTYGVKPNSHSGIVSANVTMDNLFASAE